MTIRRDLKVIYTSAQPYMVQVAIKMQDRYGWKAIYWHTTNEIENTVKNHFPEIIIHDYIQSIKGIRPKGVEHIPEGILDESILNEFAIYESIALNMMERNDSTNSFSYQERLSLYHHLLAYWMGICEYTKPDIILFEEEPHQATEYILYVVALRMHIKTILFIRTNILGKMYAVHQFEKGSKAIIDAYQKNIAESDQVDIKLEPAFDSYVKLLQRDYEEAIRFHFYDQLEKVDKLKGRNVTQTNVVKNIGLLFTKLLRLPSTLTNSFQYDFDSDQKKSNQTFVDSNWLKYQIIRNQNKT